MDKSIARERYRLDAEDAGRAAQWAGAPIADNPYQDELRKLAWAFGYLAEEMKVLRRELEEKD